MPRRRSAAEQRALKDLQGLLDRYQTNEINRDTFAQELVQLESRSRPSQRQRVQERQRQQSQGAEALDASYTGLFRWVLTEGGITGVPQGDPPAWLTSPRSLLTEEAAERSMIAKLYQMAFKDAKEEARRGLLHGNAQPAEHFLSEHKVLGLAELLADDQVLAVLQQWSIQQLEDDAAGDRLRRLFEAVTKKGKGRTAELTPEGREEVCEVYDKEYKFCVQFSRRSKKPAATPQRRQQDLAVAFNLTVEDVRRLEDEKYRLIPSVWARERTAKRMGYSPETVRQIRLKRNPTKSKRV